MIHKVAFVFITVPGSPPELYARYALDETCGNGHPLSLDTIKLRANATVVVCHECEKARSRKHKRRVLGVQRPRVA